MPKRGRLFIISGPSGSGKSTLIEAVLRQHPELRYSVSYTTRSPRGKEQDGKDYHFISEEAFQERIRAGNFAEWAWVHGYLYGTSAVFINDATARGQDVLLDIDVAGARKLLARFPEAISIFVAPPNMEELKRRLTARNTDSPAAVKKRLSNAEAELTQARHYDHIVLNQDLGQAIAGIESILAGRSGNE